MNLKCDTLHRRITHGKSMRSKLAAAMKRTRARLRQLEAVPDVGVLGNTVASEAALALAALQERHGIICKTGTIEELGAYVGLLQTVAGIVEKAAKPSMHGDRITLGKLRINQVDERLAFDRQKFDKEFMMKSASLFLKWMEEKREEAGDILDTPGVWQDRVNKIGELMFGDEWRDAVVVDEPKRLSMNGAI